MAHEFTGGKYLREKVTCRRIAHGKDMSVVTADFRAMRWGCRIDKVAPGNYKTTCKSKRTGTTHHLADSAKDALLYACQHRLMEARSRGG